MNLDVTEASNNSKRRASAKGKAQYATKNKAVNAFAPTPNVAAFKYHCQIRLQYPPKAGDNICKAEKNVAITA